MRDDRGRGRPDPQVDRSCVVAGEVEVLDHDGGAHRSSASGSHIQQLHRPVAFRLAELQALPGEIAADRSVDHRQRLVERLEAGLDPTGAVEEVGDRASDDRGLLPSTINGSGVAWRRPGRGSADSLGVLGPEGRGFEQRRHQVAASGQQVGHGADIVLARS